MATNGNHGSKPQHVFTPADLWGADGQPSAADVQQKDLGDCFLVAAAGVVAQQTPDVIRSAIQYDEASQAFSVRLMKDNQWIAVPVSQAELMDNVQGPHRGGSTFRISDKGTEGALWPALFEVAYSKRDGATWAAGQATIDKGGNPAAVLKAITGEAVATLRPDDIKQMEPQDIVDQINTKLASGRRVVMTTTRDSEVLPNDASALDGVIRDLRNASKAGTLLDGVTGHHAYMVMGARFDEASGEAMIRVRNTWGNNRIPDFGKRTGAAEIEVSLQDLMGPMTRSFGKFDIASLPMQQRGLIDAIRQSVGDRPADEAIAAAAVQASKEGIVSAAHLKGAVLTDDGRLCVAGHTPGFRTVVDTKCAQPSLDQSANALASEASRLQSESHTVASVAKHHA